MTKTIQAKFPGNPATYSYFVPEGDEPKVGDLILTSLKFDQEFYDSDFEGRFISDARIAAVVDVPRRANDKATKFYLQLISRKKLFEDQKRNREWAAKEAARKEARKKLDAKLSLRDRMADYERLASEDAEAAELLRTLKE